MPLGRSQHKQHAGQASLTTQTWVLALLITQSGLTEHRKPPRRRPQPGEPRGGTKEEKKKKPQQNQFLVAGAPWSPESGGSVATPPPPPPPPPPPSRSWGGGGAPPPPPPRCHCHFQCLEGGLTVGSPWRHNASLSASWWEHPGTLSSALNHNTLPFPHTCR